MKTAQLCVNSDTQPEQQTRGARHTAPTNHVSNTIHRPNSLLMCDRFYLNKQTKKHKSSKVQRDFVTDSRKRFVPQSCNICGAVISRCVDAQQYETRAGRMRALKASAVIKNSMRKRNQLKYNTPSRTLGFNPSCLCYGLVRH